MICGRTSAGETSLKYVAAFYVEADSQEALKSAVEYVLRRLEGGLVGYTCGAQACICEVEAAWDGTVLTVRTYAECIVYAVAKLLVKAYTWLGGKAIQVVRL